MDGTKWHRVSVRASHYKPEFGRFNRWKQPDRYPTKRRETEMKIQMKMKSIFCMICLCLGLSEPCRAVVITQAGASGFSVVNNFDGTASKVEFSNFPVTGGASVTAGGSVLLANGQASVSLIHNPGIQLYSSSAMGGSIYYSETIVGANWQDVIRVTGSLLPSTLRIQLQVEGRLDLREGDGEFISGSEARVGVALLRSIDNPLSGTSIPQSNAYARGRPHSEVWAGAQASPAGLSSFFLSGDNTNAPTYEARNLRHGAGTVSWDVLFDLRYDNTLGGYGMNLYASAYTSGHNYTSSPGGIGVADFGGTIRLTGVTLTDGNAVPGGMTFDSGFTLGTTASPVPEPTSLAIFGLGSVLVVATRRRAHGGT